MPDRKARDIDPIMGGNELRVTAKREVYLDDEFVGYVQSMEVDQQATFAARQPFEFRMRLDILVTHDDPEAAPHG